MNKNRDSRLDLIRTVAIISVISVHFLFYCGYYETIEYSCAGKLPIRQAGNRLSGLTETACASLLA